MNRLARLVGRLRGDLRRLSQPLRWSLAGFGVLLLVLAVWLLIPVQQRTHLIGSTSAPAGHDSSTAPGQHGNTAPTTGTSSPHPSPPAPASGTTSKTVPSPSSTPNKTSPSSGTTTPTASGSQSGSQSQSSPSSGGASPVSSLNCSRSPHNCGFPDETNTGPTGCSSYTQESGNISITTDGAVIQCVQLNGSFDIYANNVTIQNSIITSTNWWGINQRTGYSGLKILHTTITGVAGQGPDNGGEDYAIAQGGSGPLEIGWNNISEFGDAISIGDGNVHDNYVHDLQSYIPLCGNSPCSYYEHTDDLISDGADAVGLTVRHNTMFNQMTTDHGASATIGLFADNGPVSNATIDNNLLAGGAYALYPGGGSSSSNISVTNNHFSTLYWPTSGFYGANATSYWHTGSGNTWSGNVWDDGPLMGQPVSP